jgi:Cu-Zn family superoxide dismutase
MVVAGMIILTTASIVAASGARHASATIIDGSGATVGSARFTEDATGRLHVNVQVHGLTEGQHGIHLHAIGSCIGPSFASAGGHHNPFGAKHGLENPDGPHAGDLPNLEVNVAGHGRLQATTDRATLAFGQAALLDADGSALIIHASPDDQLTDPTGNSGGRVACGVIAAD